MIVVVAVVVFVVAVDVVVLVSKPSGYTIVCVFVVAYLCCWLFLLLFSC